MNANLRSRNGRSNQQYIATSSQARAALWKRLFGASELPVLHPEPRLQQIPGVGAKMAYDLDLTALHGFARLRLAAHVARRTGMDYALVSQDVMTMVSWPIRAEGCVLVETAVSERKRPFLLPGWNMLWPAHNGSV
jgi:hypothetical protein